MFVTKYRQR